MVSAHVLLKAQFYDLDPMRIVWHGNYARFFEQARCALLEQIGFGYRQMAETRFDWPIVDMRIKYVRSMTLGQEVRVEAKLVEYESRLRIAYRIEDVASGEVLTKGETVQFAVDRATGEVSLETPAEILAYLRAASQ